MLRPLSPLRLLKGLGIVGAVLANGETYLPRIRTALDKEGFSNYEISAIFLALRTGQVMGIRVLERRVDVRVMWSLPPTVQIDI